MKYHLLIPCLAALCLVTACKEEAPQSASAQETQADHNNEITERYWKLVELNGQPVNPHQNEAHIILKAQDNRATGSSGCNRFTGTYELKEPNRLHFSQMAGTRMACMEGMDIEQGFLKVLENADHYTLDGDKMTLNRARMAPLARFEAVYLR